MYLRCQAGENGYHSCQLVTSHNGPNTHKIVYKFEKDVSANC